MEEGHKFQRQHIWQSEKIQPPLLMKSAQTQRLAGIAHHLCFILTNGLWGDDGTMLWATNSSWGFHFPASSVTNGLCCPHSFQCACLLRNFIFADLFASARGVETNGLQLILTSRDLLVNLDILKYCLANWNFKSIMRWWHNAHNQLYTKMST